MPTTHSVYRSSTMATTMTMNDTEKIWQPEPMSEEKISGWLDGRNTSPCTCFHPYSSPRSLSWWYSEGMTRNGVFKKTMILIQLTILHSANNKRAHCSKNGWVDKKNKTLPCHLFLPLCCIGRNPFLVFSSESWTPDPPRKWPSWRSWRWRTNESKIKMNPDIVMKLLHQNKPNGQLRCVKTWSNNLVRTKLQHI